MTFTTSSDEIVRKKTLAVFIVFTIIFLFPLFHSIDKWIWNLSFFSFFMSLLFYTYLNRPSNYQIDNDKIIICRPVGNIEIFIKDIERIDRVHHDLIKNSLYGGAFGYFGNFDTELGKIKFYPTRRDKLVLLTKKDKTKLIVTPDLQDKFIEEIEKLAGRQHGLAAMLADAK